MASSASTTSGQGQALAEAGGFKGGKMTLSYNADSPEKGWTEATCNSIKSALGVDCVATPVVDFATFRTQIGDPACAPGCRKMKGMFRTGWQMDYPSIENFLAPLYATGASSNDGDYSNPAFDKAPRRGCCCHRPGCGEQEVPGGRGSPRQRHAGHPHVALHRHDGLVRQGHWREDHRLRHDRLPKHLPQVRKRPTIEPELVAP